MSKITINTVSKRFGEVNVLQGISLVAEESSLLTLLGPSGCGKTTLLRLVAGLEQSESGTIRIGDRAVSDPERGINVPAAQRNVGMVFQSYALWPHRRVWENVAHPLRVRKVTRDQVRDRVMEALRLVQLEHLSERFPGELSGGQQQRVALARAIVYEPDVLLLDEPLSNLDAKLRTEMRYEIRELQRRCRLTTIYVTHDQEEAFVISDRVCLMNQGVLEQVGEGLDLYENPATSFTAEFVGAANQLEGEVIAINGRDSLDVKIAETWMLRARNTSNPPAVGEKVCVVVRPHDIQLTQVPTALNGGIQATVRTSSYLGGTTEYVIETAQLKMRVREVGRPRFLTGHAVYAAVGDMRSVIVSSSSA
jgi:iron(III) transport system ATP-binding protein